MKRILVDSGVIVAVVIAFAVILWPRRPLEAQAAPSLGIVEHAANLAGCTPTNETPPPGILCWTDDLHVYISPAGCTAGASCFQPAAGSQGPAGATGATGPQGPAGPAGAPGAPGVNGVTQITVCNVGGANCGPAQTGAVQLNLAKSVSSSLQ